MFKVKTQITRIWSYWSEKLSFCSDAIKIKKSTFSSPLKRDEISQPFSARCGTVGLRTPQDLWQRSREDDHVEFIFKRWQSKTS